MKNGSSVFHSDTSKSSLKHDSNFFFIHFGNPLYLLPWLVLAPLIQQMESLWFEIDVGVHQITGHKLHSTFFDIIILSLKMVRFISSIVSLRSPSISRQPWLLNSLFFCKSECFLIEPIQFLIRS